MLDNVYSRPQMVFGQYTPNMGSSINGLDKQRLQIMLLNGPDNPFPLGDLGLI